MTTSTVPERWIKRGCLVQLITCVACSAANDAWAAEPASTTDANAPVQTGDAETRPDAPVTAAAPGTAENRLTRGMLLGGGIGAAVPGGDISEGLPFDDVVDSFTLGHLDVGYRFNERFLLGAYLEGGNGSINTSVLEACDDPTIDCSASLVRVGLQARAYLLTQSRFQPWGGVGFGYEWFVFSAESEGYDDSFTLRAEGAERLRLTLGLDIWAGHNHFASVQIGYSLGKYGEATYSDSLYETTNLDSSEHHSVTAAVTYNLML